jgi:hypothetical protein
MSAFPSQTARKQAQNVTRFLPTRPHEAFARLPQIECTERRMKLAALIARSWPKQDINTAWNAVSQATLHANEKQLMFNELWG